MVLEQEWQLNQVVKLLMQDVQKEEFVYQLNCEN